ncbi:hypothetical protein GGR57DRAFT_306045 [Xylariaceae sp. FL1272]|nr:hypothetical protein GGR57DRAFT_306045 [Xylariaceae sp. FL1272]
MQFNLGGLLSCLAIGALGFKVPVDQDDDVYLLSFYSTNTPGIDSISLPEPVILHGDKPRLKTPRSKTPNWLKCGGHEMREHESYRATLAQMQNYFAKGVSLPHGGIVIMRAGDVFLAVCNYGDAHVVEDYQIENCDADLEFQCDAHESGHCQFEKLLGKYRKIPCDLSFNHIPKTRTDYFFAVSGI